MGNKSTTGDKDENTSTSIYSQKQVFVDAKHDDFVHAEHDDSDIVKCSKDCDKLFEKSIATKKIDYLCSACYVSIKDEDEIFMCMEHKDDILCPLCHGYEAEIQIYKRITNKMSFIDLNDDDIAKQYELKAKKSLNEVNKNAVINLDKICSNYYNHKFIVIGIYDVIILFIAKSDIIKMAPYKSLLHLFDTEWNIQCKDTQPPNINKWNKDDIIRFSGEYTKFRLHKLNMTINELQEIKNNTMWTKFVAPNTKEIEWNEFKTNELTKPFFNINTKKENDLYLHSSNKIDIYDKCLLLGDILKIICNDNINNYPFDAILMDLKNYSYGGHWAYPGGPPQCCGYGKCIIFNISDDQDAVLYVVTCYTPKAIAD